MQRHTRLTIKEVKAQYKDGLLTSKGLVYNWLLAAKKGGLKKKVRTIWSDLGLSKSAFYKAIKELRLLGLIDFTVQGEIEMWVTNRITEIEPKDPISYEEAADNAPEAKQQ